ncbi:MAG: hypothetical protein Q8P21_00120 [bacterium]|nr:hypothetical protein [bacterium]
MQLCLSDFDGTIAQTFVPSPRGVGVHEAYSLSLRQIFGDTGVMLYQLVGGIQNRTPGELLEAVLVAAGSHRENLTERSRFFLEREGKSLDGFVPEGKGGSLEWNAACPLPAMTEVLVRVKMQILFREIGKLWPKPCKGFVCFYRHLREKNGAKLGILSSGHDLFIEKCFEVWGESQPDLMVTDDLMRSRRCCNIPPEKRAKPQAGPYRMFCDEWFAKYGTPVPSRMETFYVGDSQATDGAMAKKLGLFFVWFNPDENGSGPRSVYSVSDWRSLTPFV